MLYSLEIIAAPHQGTAMLHAVEDLLLPKTRLRWQRLYEGAARRL
jgi:hypothetical protein